MLQTIGFIALVIVITLFAFTASKIILKMFNFFSGSGPHTTIVKVPEIERLHRYNID